MDEYYYYCVSMSPIGSLIVEKYLHDHIVHVYDSLISSRDDILICKFNCQ